MTARELETLRYVARGLSTAEIAREASVSETTVKTHIALLSLSAAVPESSEEREDDEHDDQN